MKGQTRLVAVGIAVTVASVFGLVAVNRFEPFAPRFQGKTVRQFIEESPDNLPLREDMIRAFGLKAIPYLSAGCRRSLVIHWTRRWLPVSLKKEREERWLHNSTIAHRWLYRLGDESVEKVAISLADQRDFYNLETFLHRRAGTNELATYARQSSNAFLKREATKVLELKMAGIGLRHSAAELATFP